MASFWDEPNLDHCAGPPGVPPGGFQPNCFAGIACGISLEPTRYPLITLGANNFCFEFWHRPNVRATNWNGPNDTVDVGFWKDPTNVGNNRLAFTWFRFPQGINDRSIYDSDVPNLQVFNAFAAMEDWHYHVVNYDRAGNMELWRDAVQTDFVGINNSNLGDCAFAPWVGASNDENTWWDDYHDNDISAWDNFGFFNGIIGPVAAHVGTLLTAAQMRDAMERRYVNLLAQTQVLFDWRTVEGVQGWDGDRTHIIRGISSYATTPIAAPEGTDGTVLIPDLSGNDNDFTLRTRPVYGTNIPGVYPFPDWAAVGLSCCALASDPFFRHGGLT